MKGKAQASLEYLMTYGWALILIATVIGVLVFIVSSPSSTITFSSSNPTKIILKGGAITGSTAEIVLQNITGGSIKITSSLGCTVNGGQTPSQPSPVTVPAGGLIALECSAPGGELPPLTVQYTDWAGLDRSVEITASGTGAGGPSGPTGYIAYYSFNDSGDLGHDDSGNGYNGTLGPGGNEPTMETDCPSQNCLEFWETPSENYVFIQDDPDLDFGASDDFSISLWFKTNDYDNPAGFIDKPGSNPNGRYSMYLSTTIRSVIGDGTNAVYAVGLSGYNDDLWHHAVMVVDRTNQIMYMYSDGFQGDSEDISSVGSLETTSGIKIGTRSAGGMDLTGYIDEVKIYRRIITQTEVCNECNSHAAAVNVTCNCS